jgi:hypothetical protein
MIRVKIKILQESSDEIVPILPPPQDDEPEDKLRTSKNNLTPIQQSNLDFLNNLINDAKAKKELQDLGIYFKDHLVDFVKNIKILSRAKLIEYITGRNFGKVFKLDNGRVLKMFSKSLDAKEDISWYSKSLRGLFKGHATPQSLPIFDYGSPVVGGLTIYWGEMAEIIPLDKWVKQTGRGMLSQNELELLMRFYNEENSTRIIDFGNWLSKRKKAQEYDAYAKNTEQMLAKLTGRESTAKLTIPEMTAFLEAYHNLLAKDGNEPNDIFSRNVGKLPQSKPDKPIFIIFDN